MNLRVNQSYIDFICIKTEKKRVKYENLKGNNGLK